MNNPFDYIPDAACAQAFEDLVARLEKLRESGETAAADFCRELDSGKMLGVLIAEDSEGVPHTFYAFSGQIGNRGFTYPGFVGPVFDYLHPDGYFKSEERKISRLNAEISLFETESLAAARVEFEKVKKRLDAEVSAFREKCRRSKIARDELRKSGVADDETLVSMTRQSQFEKAELNRLKKKVAADLDPYVARLAEVQAHLDSLKERRKTDSENLQDWLFSNFRLLNARAEKKSLSEIFAETSLKVPPSGAGECCAPKLLQAAYLQGLKPVAIAEYWYGAPKNGEVRRHGEHYPACRGKCLPVLTWMLQGLDVEPPLSEAGSECAAEPEVVFKNRWFCVVSKPGGMLSVPGKVKALSVQEWLERKFGADRDVKVAHRLDRDTSGLLIATFGASSFKTMQQLFATRKVKKTYIADLEGDYRELGVTPSGQIELPLAPDLLDRPRQKVDFENGKEAKTGYEFTGVTDGRSRVVFHPLTGRTHQLRVHAASELGLGMPITGDPIYGKKEAGVATRMRLHARKIEFTFPLDGKHYVFEDGSRLPD